MKILFVCIKNPGRSPMAEALLKMSARGGIQVRSARIQAFKFLTKGIPTDTA
jgi:protein-tyrosine-phosphatase